MREFQYMHPGKAKPTTIRAESLEAARRRVEETTKMRPGHIQIWEVEPAGRKNPRISRGGRYEVSPSSGEPIRVELDAEDIERVTRQKTHPSTKITLTFFSDGRFSHLDSYQAARGAVPFPKWSERDRARLIQYASGFVQESLGGVLGAAVRPVR